MTESRHRQTLFLLLGVVLLIPPIFIVARWIMVATSSSGTQNELVSEFLSVFPTAVQDATLLTWIAILFSVGAVAAGSAARTGSTAWKRLVGVLTALVGGLIALWLLFSLM